MSRGFSGDVFRLGPCKPVGTEENVQSKRSQLEKTNSLDHLRADGRNSRPVHCLQTAFPFSPPISLQPGLRLFADQWFCFGLFSIQNDLITKTITRLIFSKWYNYIVWPTMLYGLMFLDVRAFSVIEIFFSVPQNNFYNLILHFQPSEFIKWD